MAAFFTRAWSFLAGSNGALVERSSTSSTAWKRPRPRMSPTCGWLPKRSPSRRRSSAPMVAHVGQKIVALDRLLHREPRRAGQRMAHVGVAMLEEAAALGEGVVDGLAEQHGADRLVAAAQSLGDGHEVGRDAFLLAGMQRAGAAHAAHHLVEDQQHAVAIADLADALEVAFGRRHRARRRADHRLGDEGHHRVGTELEDLRPRARRRRVGRRPPPLSPGSWKR